MSTDTASEVKFEIGHVLFIDIVAYSQLLITQQSQQLDTLKQIVRGTEQLRAAEAEGKLLRLPTGDGGALVFRTTPEAPVLCALEIARELKNHPELCVRMGIHSGPVNEITDLNEQANIAGAGINMAQRVMDCGDNGHILLSKRVADDLAQYPRWRSFLHDLGECEVKHGVRIDVVNFYGDGIGNPQVPKRFQILQKHRAPIRWALIAAVAIAAALLAFQFARTRKPAATELPKQTAPIAAQDKSVAVLPFENLSSDKENAFFAQGIQDEIITTLSRISGLRVISRTSTARYSSAPENLPEIAKQLHVTNVLEGSVQKAEDRVHINVQLIRADNDAHLWAQSYDRRLTDIFGVEAEVAKSIADSLQATLSPQEKARVETKPTTNADAYVLYLRARDYQTRPDNLLQDFKAAINLYDQALKLDPNFALAHARLSATTSNLYHFYEPIAAWKQKVYSEALDSLRLQPNLGEGHLALGLYRYYTENDYDAALREMKLAAEALPNDGDVGLYTAAVLRRRGDLKASSSPLINTPNKSIRATRLCSMILRRRTSVCAIGARQPNEWIACSLFFPILSTSKYSVPTLSFSGKAARHQSKPCWNLCRRISTRWRGHFRTLGCELDGPRYGQRRESPGELPARHDYFSDGRSVAEKLSSSVHRSRARRHSESAGPVRSRPAAR